MKFKYLTSLIILIGIAVLFFFPEPEANFFAYVGTALIFIILTIFSIIWKKRKKDGNKTEKI
jgi:L-asparagine transporter-like permease